MPPLQDSRFRGNDKFFPVIPAKAGILNRWRDTSFLLSMNDDNGWQNSGKKKQGRMTLPLKTLSLRKVCRRIGKLH